MERKLEEFIAASATVTDVANLSPDMPKILRITSPAINKTITFVVSVIEPHQMVLPLNVVWLCFDATTNRYEKAFGRISKEASADTPDLMHTWKELYFYEEAMGEQAYDAVDQAKLGDMVSVQVATTDSLGVVALASAPPEGEEGMPRVLLEGDPRMTDAREPLEHSHTEIPATILKHESGQVTIVNGTATEGFAIVADSATSASWKKIKQADLQA